MAVKYSKLSSKLYRVLVPVISTYTEAELMYTGMSITETSKGGISDPGAEMTRVMLPLSKIIDIYSTGAPIKLVDTDALTEIYKALEAYIHETNSVTPVFNAAVHHEDRDLDIDRFAEEMFNLNRHTIVNSMINRKSGFDIGIHKMAITNTRVKPRSTFRKGKLSDAYAEQNTGVTDNINDVYLTHTNTYVDPNDVTRKPRVRKRQKLKARTD